MVSTIERAERGTLQSRIFRGQPLWFSTLFWVDMWERFSFYGMVAILYLYVSAPVADGGFGMAAGSAAALFGSYMALAFVAAMPGGWLADRVLGPRRAVLYGGICIAAGHYTMSLPVRDFLYIGLLLVIAGTGLIKPAIAGLVSSPHADDNQRREAALSIFYMSIQMSALIAPIVTGLLAERVDWHAGFAAAAVGMTIGLIVYVLGARRFGQVGLSPAKPVSPERLRVVRRRVGAVVALLLALLAADVLAGTFAIEHVLALCGLLVLGLPVVCLVLLRRNPALDATHRRRLGPFTALLAASAVFWLLYAQGGSVLSMFAQEHTDRSVLGWQVPASWFQSAHPMFILLLAPLFAVLWMRLGRRVDVPVKFAGALVCVGLSWIVLAWAAQLAVVGGLVSPGWLLLVYLMQVCGELALAPVGLSLAVQVAPPGFKNQYLALFWLFAAVGAGLGGQLARLSTVVSLPAYFMIFGLLAGGVGVVLLLVLRRLRAGLADSEPLEPVGV